MFHFVKKFNDANKSQRKWHCQLAKLGFYSYYFGRNIRHKDGHDIIFESHASKMYFTSIKLQLAEKEHLNNKR